MLGRLGGFLRQFAIANFLLGFFNIAGLFGCGALGRARAAGSLPRRDSRIICRGVCAKLLQCCFLRVRSRGLPLRQTLLFETARLLRHFIDASVLTSIAHPPRAVLANEFSASPRTARGPTSRLP